MFHDEMVYFGRLSNSDPILTMLVYNQLGPAERCKLLLVMIKYAESFFNGVVQIRSVLSIRASISSMRI